MKISQIIQETTTSGSIAPMETAMMTQSRGNSVKVPGLQPIKKVMSKASKKKGPYANSLSESAIKEEEISEQDLIVVPGQGRLKRTGFVKHDMDQGEHEGQTLKNSLHTIIRVATHLDKALSLQSEFPEWVSEKIGSVKSNMVNVMDYLISSQEMQHDSDAMEEVSTGGLFGAGAALAIAPEAGLTGARAGYEAGSAIQKAFTKESNLHPEHITYLQRQAEISRKTGLKVGDRVTIKGRPGFEGKIVHDWGGGDFTISGGGGGVDQGDNHRANARIIQKIQGMTEGKIDFAKKLQKKIDNSNKAVVQTKKDIGHRIADIGPGGKEHNVQTNKAWDDANKVVEGKRTMSRAAKGYEKYGKEGMQALAKAGREGKDLDKVRDKYNKYDEGVTEDSDTKLPDLSKIRTHKLEELLALQSEIGRRDPRTKASAELIRAELKKRGVMTAEGANVDRMVRHIEKSEEKAGKSKKEAENIAWATANKRGMLNNRNKK